MSNPTRSATKSQASPKAPNLNNVANGPVMTWDNLNAQTFPMTSNPMENAYGDEAKPRTVSANQSFENATPNVVRSATKGK